MSKAEHHMNGGNVDEAISYARQCLQQQLAPELTYHNLAHTFEQVMPAAMNLAERYGVSQEEKDLLAVAVAFHDIGWIVQGPGHERIGADLARQKLPSFGFSERQIERIATLILATQMPHQPKDLLENILVDADLAILSRDDFWECNARLRAETEMLGNSMSDCQWYENQLAFFEAHRFFTDGALDDRDQVKQQHVFEMRRRLAICEAGSSNGQSRANPLVKSENDV